MVDMILFIVQIFVLPVLALIQLIIAAYRYRDSKKHTDPRTADFWAREQKRLCRSLWGLGVYVSIKFTILLFAILIVLDFSRAI